MKSTLLPLILILSINLFSQFEVIYTPPCDLIPLEFQEEIKPIWSHLVIDSTFIDYRDTNARYQPYYKDGMEQFGFDGGSFIHDNNLYSITEVDYDLDLSGYYIEKIDLDTGVKLWTIRTDLRHSEYREKLMSSEIDETQLKLNGIRCIVSDDLLAPSNFKLGGRIDALYFQRTYDVETGQLISYNSVPETDENSYIIHYKTNKNNLLSRGQNEFDIITINASRAGGFIERVGISNHGVKRISKDTVLHSFYNELDLSEARFALTKKFIQLKDGHMIHFNQVFFGEDFDASPPQSKLMKLDSNYNIIREFDINTLGLPSYGSISLISFTEDGKILLRGCSDQNLYLPCRFFYLVFDTELKHLNTLTPYIDNHYFSFSFDTEVVQEDNSVIAIDRNTEKNGNSSFVIYELNSDNQFDTLKTLRIKEINWGAWVSNAFQLDNGDFLIKFNYGCLDYGGSLASWHPTWMRFAAEDIQLSTNTQVFGINEKYYIQLYPNPVSDLLNIKLDKPIQGNITIVNAMGEVVLKNRLTNSSYLNLNTEDLPTGIYNVIVSGDEGIRSCVQFVKQ